jgi:hypothetical protein
VFYLVSELAVGDHALDVEVDVTSLERVRQQTESQRIGTALRNALGEVALLSFDGLGHFVGIQVAAAQRVVQTVQRNTVHHVDRIDDVTQTLRLNNNTKKAKEKEREK